ncbi:MAG: hypothetical protein MJZ34_02595 [Paludibacteraceae bacterium]|nr:hypothetical protein [Paludibacteraceae bacterium]
MNVTLSELELDNYAKYRKEKLKEAIKILKFSVNSMPLAKKDDFLKSLDELFSVEDETVLWSHNDIVEDDDFYYLIEVKGRKLKKKRFKAKGD